MLCRARPEVWSVACLPSPARAPARRASSSTSATAGLPSRAAHPSPRMRSALELPPRAWVGPARPWRVSRHAAPPKLCSACGLRAAGGGHGDSLRLSESGGDARHRRASSARATARRHARRSCDVARRAARDGARVTTTRPNAPLDRAVADTLNHTGTSRSDVAPQSRSQAHAFASSSISSIRFTLNSSRWPLLRSIRSRMGAHSCRCD
jgi:hypothetical protein